MHQTIVLDTNIYKGSEVHHIAYCPLQNHTWLQIFNFQHIMSQNGSRQRITWIEPWLFQILQNIMQRRQTNPYFPGNISPHNLLAITICTATTLTIATPKTILQLDQLTELSNTL